MLTQQYLEEQGYSDFLDTLDAATGTNTSGRKLPNRLLDHIKSAIPNYVDFYTTKASENIEENLERVPKGYGIVRLTKVDTEFPDELDGFKRHQGLELILQTTDPRVLAVYSNPETRQITAFSAARAPEAHALALPLHALIILSIYEKAPDSKYYKLGQDVLKGDMDAIKKFFEDYLGHEITQEAMKEKFLKECIGKSAEKNLKNAVAMAKRNVENIRDNIARLKSQLNDSFVSLNNALKELLWAETRKAEEDPMIMEYFKNECDADVKASKEVTGIIYRVLAPLDFYDGAFAKTYFDRLVDTESKETELLKVLEHMFVNPKYKIWTKSELKYDHLSGSIRDYQYTVTYENIEYIAQPHIMRYSCWGSAAPVISECLRNGEQYAGLMQAHAACKNMNLADTVVTKGLVSELKRKNNIKTIEKIETGEFITFTQFLEEVTQNGEIH